MSDVFLPPPGKIIPLMPGISRATGERRTMLREAVKRYAEGLLR